MSDNLLSTLERLAKEWQDEMAGEYCICCESHVSAIKAFIAAERYRRGLPARIAFKGPAAPGLVGGKEIEEDSK